MQVLVCADLWKDAATLHAAYHDSQGITKAFIKNGLSNALSAVGADVLPGTADWTYDVVVNADLKQVWHLRCQLLQDRCHCKV